VTVPEVKIDGKAVRDRVRSERDRFVGFVKEAVEDFPDGDVIRQNAKFANDTTLELDDGTRIEARTVIIATGSRPNIPPPFKAAGDRLITNDDVFDWTGLPASVAVYGADVIGLELGQALHRLGVRVHLFSMGGSVAQLTDPDLLAYGRKTYDNEFAAHFDAKTDISRDDDEIVVRWSEGDDSGEERFGYLLAATGRAPNVDGIGLENTSLVLNDKSLPEFDPMSMLCTRSDGAAASIFIAGDPALSGYYPTL